MKNNVTKQDVIDFYKSFMVNGTLHHIQDEVLVRSLWDLIEIVETYFLFGKPRSYILQQWEYDNCFKMGEPDFTPKKGYKFCNLEPLFLEFIRDKKLNSII
jgi:hypothetical protein